MGVYSARYQMKQEHFEEVLDLIKQVKRIRAKEGHTYSELKGFYETEEELFYTDLKPFIDFFYDCEKNGSWVYIECG